MDLSAFNRLEEKIEELLERLNALGEENALIRSRLEEKDKEVAELQELLEAQDTERDQVRNRVEQLLAKLDTL